MPNNFHSLSLIESGELNGCYIFCYVVYENITKLVKEAKKDIELKKKIEKPPVDEEKDRMNASAIELEAVMMGDLYLTPTIVSDKQENYYFPVTFGVKTRKNYQSQMKKFLKFLVKKLKSNPFKSNSDLVRKELFCLFCQISDENLKNVDLFRLIQFSSHLFFGVNNFIIPIPNTTFNYSLGMICALLIYFE